MSLLFGPELYWILVCIAASWLPVRNAASTLMWLAPPAAVILSFVLGFQLRTPTWWLLVRLVLGATVGVCVATSSLAEKIDAGSGRSGVPMGMMLAIVLHLFILACATVTGIVLLAKAGTPGGISFLKQGALAVAIIAGLIFSLLFLYDRQTERMTGEEKARRFSQAHGEKIEARYAADWKDQRKNWTNFEIAFVAPNSIRLTSKVHYTLGRFSVAGEKGDRHLAQWNGEVGAAFLEFIQAKQPWRASWDEESPGDMVWSVSVDMKGLSKNQFLEITDEAARLYIGPLARFAGNDSWWLLGEAINNALDAPAGKFSLAWLETALGQAASYYERSPEFKEKQDRLRQLHSLRDEAHRLVHATNVDAQAKKRLIDSVRAVESWRQIAHAESDSAFLLNGSLPYIGLARRYAETHP